MKAFKPFFMTALAVVFFASTLCAYAQQSTSSTSTSGQASSGAAINSGNDQTGGWSNGGANGTYNAAGKNLSEGGANSTTQAQVLSRSHPIRHHPFRKGRPLPVRSRSAPPGYGYEHQRIRWPG